jgi:predicted ester cyclase
MMFNAFPDLRIEVEQTLASGDFVVARVRLTGTHKGNFAGVAPTNKSVSWRGCSVVELRNGKAIRSRVYADNASLLQQIGAISLARPTAAG